MFHTNLKGEVVVFFTGGTIGMSPAEGVHGVAPGNNFHKLLNELAPQPEGITLRPVLWSDFPSPHMTPEDMFRLAGDIREELESEGVLGAVVLHGTDVLVETAYMIDITVDSPKPVVLTGSMRYYSELGYEGIRNLINSIGVCLQPPVPETGVLLCMNDRLFTAREAVKVNSLNVDAFESRDSGIIGYIAGNEVLYTGRAYSTHPPRIETDTIALNVTLLTAYTGMDSGMIDHALEQGAAGLVIEGFGAGNIPPGAMEGIENCLSAGVPTVLTTRCIEGGVWPVYGYKGGGADLQDKGVIMGGNLGGPKARIRLMCALGMTRDMAELKRLFQDC